MRKKYEVIGKVILGVLLFLMMLIFLLSMLTDTTVSQNKVSEKKISMIQYSKSKEFLNKQITHLIVHWEYTDSTKTRIKQVIDSVFIEEGK